MQDDNEALSNARAEAQKALSRARLTTDPDTKMMWAHLAEGWVKLVHDLEELQERKRAKAKPSAPQKAR